MSASSAGARNRPSAGNSSLFFTKLFHFLSGV
jgi:hypothetical protein